MADAAAAAAARHAEQTRLQNLAVLQQRCSTLAVASVKYLDEMNAAADFHRQGSVSTVGTLLEQIC